MRNSTHKEIMREAAAAGRRKPRPMPPDTSVIIAEIQRLECECYQAGMNITGIALNRAQNALGWETAGEKELAAMAARGERPDK